MTDADHPTHLNPYDTLGELTSSGRVLLAQAMTHYCLLHWGLDAQDVTEGLSAEAYADGLDGDHRTVRMAARLLGRAFADGAVETFARPFDGGRPVRLDRELWEVDDPSRRFLTSALNLERPFERRATPDHWIFVDEAGWDALIERSCDIRPARQHRSSKPEGVAAARLAAVPPAALAETSAPERLLRLSEVKDRTGLARSTIYAKIRQNRFPRQLDTEGNLAVWREAEVAAWVADPR